MSSPPVVLLIEDNPDLRELNQLALEAFGYTVESVPSGADPVAVAPRTHPAVIVLGISPTDPHGWSIVDQLRTDPQTDAIPVVVVSTSKRAATEAQAAPNVSVAVVAPYDLDALDQAIAHALGHPPPAAVLPGGQAPSSPAIQRATQILVHDSRRMILRAVDDLRRSEPFQSRFAELSPALIDELPTIIGAVAQGMQRDLPAGHVAAVPDVRGAVERHSSLRRDQGIPLEVVIGEYQTLRDEMIRTLEDHTDAEHFTAKDAFELVDRLNAYIDRFVQLAMECYRTPRPS